MHSINKFHIIQLTKKKKCILNYLVIYRFYDYIVKY